jgi:hypothetical protein
MSWIKQDFKMTSQTLQKVDHSVLKSHQIIIISLNILAFILNLPIVAALVALIMGVGSLLKVPGFGFVYKNVLKPRGWMKPDVLDDNPEPHRFAQFLGFVFMTAGSIALFSGASILGWALVWLVAALAALNAFGGFWGDQPASADTRPQQCAHPGWQIAEQTGAGLLYNPRLCTV